MASSIQFSGLSSGLDTAGIIDSLMSIEANPQTLLKNRLSTEQTKLGAMQALNTSFQALATSASSFTTGSTWKQLTATSSNSAIAVTAGTTATPATFNVTVNQLATNASLSFSDAHALTDVVATPSSALTLTLGSKTYTVDSGDGTFKSVLANLNALKDADGKSVVSATSINLGNGTYQVLMNSVATGDAAISLTGAGLNLGTATATDGKDAEISLGGTITVRSKSNTFSELMPGVSLTLGAGLTAGTTSSISVAADPSNRSTALSAMITQLNGVLTSISSATSYGTVSTTSGGTASGAGALPGDGLIRATGQQLLNTIYTTSGGVLNNIGISLDRYGQFQFDATKFAEAYAKDPNGVQEAITGTNGFAARVLTVSREVAGTAGLQADNSILPRDGQLTSMIKQQQSAITRYNTQITEWDDRLERKRASLQATYSALEKTLSNLTAQQSWLSAQIAGLDSLSSSK